VEILKEMSGPRHADICGEARIFDDLLLGCTTDSGVACQTISASIGFLGAHIVAKCRKG